MKKLYALLALTCFLYAFGTGRCAAQNKPVFSIPFTLIDNRQFIEVTIKRHTFHFILDCGADYGLDTKTAKLLNLEPRGASMQSGAGANKVAAWKGIVDTARIGPVKIAGATFLVLDMSEIREKLHLPYLDGIVGYTFMKDYAVQCDYPGKRSTFIDHIRGLRPSLSAFTTDSSRSSAFRLMAYPHR
jgi:hypothetical protein